MARYPTLFYHETKDGCNQDPFGQIAFGRIEHFISADRFHQ